MSFYTLCISSYWHDGSVSLFEEDKLIFFSHSERFSRIKASHKILDEVYLYIQENITKEIDLCIIDVVSGDRFQLLCKLQNFFKIKKHLSDELIKHTNTALFNPGIKENHSHHCTHALSAFYQSPFEECVCLVVDAIGSAYNLPSDENLLKKSLGTMGGIRGFESTSIIEVSKNFERKTLYKRSQYLPTMFQITNIQSGKVVFPWPYIGGGLLEYIPNPFDRFNSFGYEFDASNHMDIGNMYDSITRHLNMGICSEGKVMGLSAYGKHDDSIPPFLNDGTILSNNNLFVGGRELNFKLYPQLFENLDFQKRANLAYAVQKALEKMFLHYAELIKNKSKSRNLVIGGGCALNILGVSLIKKHYPEFNIFVDPIANDATHSIGVGVHYYNLIHKNGRMEKNNNFDSIYLGPKYKESEINSKIDAFIQSL